MRFGGYHTVLRFKHEPYERYINLDGVNISFFVQIMLK